MGEGTSRPKSIIDEDDVILALRTSSSLREPAPDAAKRFDEGLGVSNATVDYKAAIKADAEVLRAAHERDEGVADVVRKGNEAQAEVEGAKVCIVCLLNLWFIHLRTMYRPDE